MAVWNPSYIAQQKRAAVFGFIKRSFQVYSTEVKGELDNFNFFILCKQKMKLGLCVLAKITS
jgi:hypothetical protein